MIIGLTGGIGSGKSEAARCFAALGVPVVDVDVISHQLTAVDSPLLPQIAQALGKDMLHADGSMNRVAVRERIFNDTRARQQLETILHPAIHQQAVQQLQRNQQARPPYQILAVPLLFENQRYRETVDRALVVDCDESLQIARTMARSQLSEEAVRKILSAQMNRASRLALADDILNNESDLATLEKNVLDLHKKYIRLA